MVAAGNFDAGGLGVFQFSGALGIHVEPGDLNLRRA